MILLLERRGLNYHTLEDGRRKNGENEGIAVNAMRENRLLPCIFRNFPTVSSASKNNTLLVNSYVIAKLNIGNANIINIFILGFMLYNKFISMPNYL